MKILKTISDRLDTRGGIFLISLAIAAIVWFGIRAITGYSARVTEIPVDHHARQFGQSKYGISRTFRVVLLKDGHGVGETRTDPEQCKTVKYSGKSVTLKL